MTDEAEKEVPNYVARRRKYFWGGAAMLLLGVLFSVLNALLDCPDYQKVTSFNALFFVAGGALGLAAGAEDKNRGKDKTGDKEKAKDQGEGEDEGKEPFAWLLCNAWRVGAVVFLAAFGLSVKMVLQESLYDSTNLMLNVGVAGLYLLFLYLIRLREDEEKKAKHMETAEVLVVAIALAIGIKAVGVQAFKIPSGSMLHTLEIGDHLLVSKFLYGIPLPFTDARLPGFREPERGDVVVFAYPGMDNLDRPPFQQPGDPDVLKGQDFIKRIVGLPGESFEVRGNRLFVGGQEIEDPWGQFLDGSGRPLPAVYRTRGELAAWGPATIPADMYLVMGDNRFHSNDGRVWGFVRKGRIKGKAMFIYWSWAGLKRVGNIIR